MRPARLLAAILGIGLFSGAALAQSVPAYQMGLVQPNDVAKYQRDGQIRNAGGIAGDNNGMGVNPFSVTDYGQPGFCSNSGPTGSVGYQSLCIGHSTAGKARIEASSSAGAPPQGLEVCADGVCQTFPFGGGGAMVPPVVLTDSQTGAMTSEGATLTTLSQPGISAHTIFGWTQFPPGTPGAPPDNMSYDGVRAVVKATQGSTTNLVNAFGGYLQVDETTGVYPTGVIFFGAGSATRDGAAIWGLNTTLTDSAGPLAPTTGTGRGLFNELDLQFTSPHSSGFGLVIQGNSVVQPAGATGFSCGPLALTPFAAGTSITAKWTHCYETADGATDVAFSIGRSTPVNPAVHPQANLASQVIALGYTDPNAVPQNVQIKAVPGPSPSVPSTRAVAPGSVGGGLSITNTEGILTFLTIPGGVVMRMGIDENLNVGGPISLTSGVSLFSINDLNNGLKDLEITGNIVAVHGAVSTSIGGGTSIVQIGLATSITGSLNLTGVTGAGASNRTVCVDNTGLVLLKTGAC